MSVEVALESHQLSSTGRIVRGRFRGYPGLAGRGLFFFSWHGRIPTAPLYFW
ncbi:hypothetical protein [Vibrio fluvialis]|uniref:hypothetical protein n=1 Tax=Vibrio fluvialis TaxID=676 RepID=UPI003D7E3A94|nr:hypothetical protein [Vibrio fluvialis]